MALFLSLSLVAAAPSSAQEADAAEQAEEAGGANEANRDEEARGLFLEGRAAYQAGRFEEALEHFQRSYELSGRPELLYNVGQSADRLRRDEVALEAFEAYLAQAEEPENREQVEARILVLRESLTSHPGEAPPDPGERSPSSGGGISPVGPILAGVGGALLIGAAITGGLALGLQSDWQSQCAGMSCPAEAEGTAEEMETMALVTDILWPVGAAVAVTGVLLTFLLTDGEDTPPASVACGWGFCALTVEGSF